MKEKLVTWKFYLEGKCSVDAIYDHADNFTKEQREKT